jgi:hypothetical protein
MQLQAAAACSIVSGSTFFGASSIFSSGIVGERRKH